MKKTLIIVFILFVGFVSLPTFAQETRWKIEVEDHSEDMTGQRFIYLVKEGIRQSSSMRLTNANETRLMLIIDTMSRFPETPNIATMYSVVWAVKDPKEIMPYLLDHTIGFTGSDVVYMSAQSIVARTDKLLSDIQKATSR